MGGGAALKKGESRTPGDLMEKELLQNEC